jgi:hypothetical protein
MARSDDEPSGFVERPEPPAGSGIVVEHHSDGVTLIVPPRGIWKGGGCAIMVLGLVFLAGALNCVLAMAGIVHGEGDPFVGFWVCLIAGLAGSFLAVGHGRRRAMLVVSADRTLQVKNVDVFGTQERIWQREELAEIRTGTREGVVDDISVLELQIDPKSGPTFGLLAGRSAADLEFLAAQLRRLLRLPQQDG